VTLVERCIEGLILIGFITFYEILFGLSLRYIFSLFYKKASSRRQGYGGQV